MADEKDPFTIHMKDDTVVTNACVGGAAGFDANGVRLNKPGVPEPSLVLDTTTKQLGE
jgi:hypothetical protein